ncbi:hypothetical protein [Clostridium sp. C2-6-12]|nr:hypothetical protein [Clostridium sp. C2-6-12]
MKSRKKSNIKVICLNNDKDLKEINKRFTMLVAELVRNGEIK